MTRVIERDALEIVYNVTGRMRRGAEQRLRRANGLYATSLLDAALHEERVSPRPFAAAAASSQLTLA